MNTLIRMNLLPLMFVLISINLFAQNCHLCKAVEKGNFKRVEKIIKNKLIERKYGDQINNGNAIYTSYNNVYDDLVVWLTQKKCVDLAAWDKCQIKILPYPSYATIGVIFKTQNNEVEITFHIQEGHSSRLKYWLHARERLYYLSMEEVNGFVKKQISLCDLEKESLNSNDSLPIKDSLKSENMITPSIQKFNDTIDYTSILGKYVCVGNNDTILFKEQGNPAASVIMTRSSRMGEIYGFSIISAGKIKQIGHYSPWHIQLVGIRILQNGDIEANFSGSYSFEENAIVTLIYRKIGTE